MVRKSSSNIFDVLFIVIMAVLLFAGLGTSVYNSEGSSAFRITAQTSSQSGQLVGYTLNDKPVHAPNK